MDAVVVASPLFLRFINSLPQAAQLPERTKKLQTLFVVRLSLKVPQFFLCISGASEHIEGSEKSCSRSPVLPKLNSAGNPCLP